MDGVDRAARRAGDQRFSMEPHNVRRRDRVPGLPAALVIAFAGSTSIAWAQAAPVVPAPPAGTQTPAVPQTTYTVTVVETAPLPGVELPIEKIPAPVQTATDRDITASGALDLSDFLNRRLNGVHVNEVQGNPFQPDVNYRGYTASPLLGTPQGLSVYMDGVRLNQPFGEVVSWDLIPAHRHRLDHADAGIESAVRPEHARRRAVDSDQGRPSHAGRRPCRRSTAATRAGPSSSSTAAAARGGLHWYLAGNLFAEDGWRDDSPSDVRQFFGKLGWQRADARRRRSPWRMPTTR